MTELRFTINNRVDNDTNWSLSLLHLVDGEDEAEEAGKQAKQLYLAFQRGFAAEGEEQQ